MDTKAQLEFDNELLAAIGLGILTGFLALFIVKGAGTGLFWKLMTFVVSSIVGTVVSYYIFQSG